MQQLGIDQVKTLNRRAGRGRVRMGAETESTRDGAGREKRETRQKLNTVRRQQNLDKVISFYQLGQSFSFSLFIYLDGLY